MQLSTATDSNPRNIAKRFIDVYDKLCSDLVVYNGKRMIPIAKRFIDVYDKLCSDLVVYKGKRI